MKLMTCPVNGTRPVSEFVCWGEHREMPHSAMPHSASVTDDAWADYVFNRSGAPGVKREWWCHVPSGIWFIAERDTLADRVLRTYLWSAAGK